MALLIRPLGRSAVSFCRGRGCCARLRKAPMRETFAPAWFLGAAVLHVVSPRAAHLRVTFLGVALVRTAFLSASSLRTALVIAILLSAASASAEPLSVMTDVDKRIIAIGDTVSLNLDLEWESGVELKPVATRETLGNFIVRDIRQGVVQPAGDSFRRRVSILLTIFETGQHTIPSVPVLFTGADGTVGRIETEPVDIVVESVLADGSEDIRDIKPPLRVKKRWKEIILSYALLLGLAGAAATSVLVSVRKRSEIEAAARKIWEKVTRPLVALVAWLFALLSRRRAAEPGTYDIEVTAPDIPPEQAALAELARIEALGLMEQGLIKDLYTLVSEVLRRYTERKYGVLAMELPTSYIMRAIADRGIMSSCYGEVREVLEECDLVKFAKYIPPRETAMTIIPRTREIVRTTSETGAPALRVREAPLASADGGEQSRHMDLEA